MTKNLTIYCDCGRGFILQDAFKKNGELRKADTILANLFKHFHTGPYCKVRERGIPAATNYTFYGP